MLYELLTGRVPFEGESAVTIALKQVNERPVPPSALQPGRHARARAVVLRALEKDPARRFADADEFIAALEAARAELAARGRRRVGRPAVVPRCAAVPPPPRSRTSADRATRAAAAAARTSDAGAALVAGRARRRSSLVGGARRAVLLLHGAPEGGVPTVVGPTQADGARRAAPATASRSTPVQTTAEQPARAGHRRRTRRAGTQGREGLDRHAHRLRRAAAARGAAGRRPDVSPSARAEARGGRASRSAERERDLGHGREGARDLGLSPAEGQQVEQGRDGDARRLQRQAEQVEVPNVVGKNESTRPAPSCRRRASRSTCTERGVRGRGPGHRARARAPRAARRSTKGSHRDDRRGQGAEPGRRCPT